MTKSNSYNDILANSLRVDVPRVRLGLGFDRNLISNKERTIFLTAKLEMTRRDRVRCIDRHYSLGFQKSNYKSSERATQFQLVENLKFK